MSARTRARRLALFALAFTSATIVCARAFFLFAGCFVAGATGVFGRAVARRQAVAVRGVFAATALFTSASVKTTVFSACTFFLVVGIVAVATIGRAARRAA